jgi:hypothetical protein
MSGSNSSPPSAAHALHAVADEPLGLTVHSLPSPQQAMADAQARRTSLGRWKMVLVLLCCAAPVVASYFTYYVVRPEGRSVYGTLIEPQRPLPDIEALRPDGSSQRLSTLKGQWLLVTVADAACDAACEHQLYQQRQLRESMGREKDRIDRVWLVSDSGPVPERLGPALKGATVLRVPQAQLAQWLQPAAGHALGDHLYVVDPMGNWMMRFPAAMDIEGAGRARRDIDRLLRASASWDDPDR